MNLNKVLNSAIHYKIISFFHENPSAIDSPRGISTWIGEERDKTIKALNDLVKLEILISHKATSTTGYSYTRNNKIISEVAKFIKKKST